MIYNNIVCKWKAVNQGTTQGSVSGPYLFSIFLNDLDVSDHNNKSLDKYADDTTIAVTICKGATDESPKVLETFLNWTSENKMRCNTSKCKELCIQKKSMDNPYPPIHGIEQVTKLTALGLTLQQDCKFSVHIKEKLHAANKCLYIIRTLRKEGYQ